MSIFARIVSGTAANSISLVYTTIFNLLTTPALIVAWGATGYGIWLMLTAIPAYLALSDLGFSTAARSTMAMSIARGERERSIEVFQSLITLHLVAFALIMVVTVLALGALSMTDLGVSIQEYGLSIALISFLACLLMFARVLLSAFLAAGHYATGTLYHDTGAFIANMIILPTALLGGDVVLCIVIQIVCWTAIIACLLRLLATTIDWLPVGTSQARLSVFQELFRPAIGALAIPGAVAFSQQGVALIVGFVISPAATATLTAVRTATRMAIQAVSVVNRATILELSAAGARHDQVAVAKLLWVNVVSAVALLAPIVVAFVGFGPQIISLWTGGAVVATELLVILMTLGMVFHACWFFGTNLLIATNAHLSMVGVLLVTALAVTVLSWPAAHYFGLPGVAMLLALAEAACLIRFWFAGEAAGMTLRKEGLVDLVRAVARRGGWS